MSFEILRPAFARAPERGESAVSWEVVAKALPLLAVLMPFLGAMSRWIGLLPDSTLTAAVRLAVPWNELVASGFFEAVSASLYVAPLVWYWQWFENRIALPSKTASELLDAIKPKAAAVDRMGADLIESANALTRRTDALRTREGELTRDDPNVQSLEQDTERLRADTESFRAFREPVEADLQKIQSMYAEIERRWPRPLRAAFRLAERVPDGPRTRVLARGLFIAFFIVLYGVIFPWWIAALGVSASLVLPGLVRDALRTRAWARIALLVCAFALLSAVSDGLAPSTTRAVALTTKQSSLNGRHLLLGRTDTLVFLRPCDAPMTYFSVPWTELASIEYGPVASVDVSAAFGRFSVAQVLRNRIEGQALQIGQDTTHCFAP